MPEIFSLICGAKIKNVIIINMNIKIKNYLGITIIIVLFMLGYAALRYADTFSKSINPSFFRSFSVSAEGETIAVPDVSQFTFGVKTEGGLNLADLQRENAEKVNQAIAFVKSQGVDTKDIKTAGYNLEPRYQHYSCPKSGGACPPPDIVGYSISQTVQTKIRDFDKIGDIMAGVIKNGANTVSQFSFEIDDLSAVQNQAREKAIAKAKIKAKAIAEAGDFDLGRLLSVEENDGSGYYPVYAAKTLRVSAENADTIAPIIEAGSQEIKITITLKYEIK